MREKQMLEKIEINLKNYFEDYLIKDIKDIKAADLDFTFPYILLVCAGIDYLGGLEYGFPKNNNNSGDRMKHFIGRWMGEVNPEYRNELTKKLIYKSLRCAIAHRAIVNNELVTSALLDKGKHLWVYENKNQEQKIFIHALQFVDDFEVAYDLFKKDFIKHNIELVFVNMNAAIQEGLTPDEFKKLVDRLRSEGKYFIYSGEAVPSEAPPGSEDKCTTLSKSSKTHSISS